MNDLTQYAPAYARAGFRPLPVRENGKIPEQRDWQKSNPTPESAGTLFATHRGNVGVTFPPEFFALDVDGEEGRASLEQLKATHGDFTKTLAQRTQSGGQHFIYRKPANVSLKNAVRFMPGLDIRAEGGQIVVEPSAIDGRKYQWLNWDVLSGASPDIADAPDWLLALLTAPAPATAATNGGDIIAGGRNQALTRFIGSMNRHGADVGTMYAAATAHNKAHCNPPLPDAEVRSIVKSVARYSPEIYRNEVKPSPPFPTPDAISPEEWGNARSTPDCIVQDYLYADVGVLISPGGVGKTTLALKEAMHIVLGLPLYGLTIHKRGAVLIITAEDSREMLIARLRAICHAMQLTDADIATVMQQVRIADVSGSGFKLTEVSGDVVRPCEGIDLIIEACHAIKPVLIDIDPAVSFGVGESRVNDAEQGLIEAARKLRKALNCCIRYVHHTGKANAREKTLDQYSGRGGSAFADGSRMVHVLQTLTPDEWRAETGTELLQGESGLRIARPKMTYCVPQGDILIRRAGYRFDHVERIVTSKQSKLEDAANRIWELLCFDLGQGRYHSQNALEALDTGLKRGEIRGAVAVLFASLRVESRDIPNAGKGGKRQYLHPVGAPNLPGAAIENNATF